MTKENLELLDNILHEWKHEYKTRDELYDLLGDNYDEDDKEKFDDIIWSARGDEDCSGNLNRLMWYWDAYVDFFGGDSEKFIDVLVYHTEEFDYVLDQVEDGRFSTEE